MSFFGIDFGTTNSGAVKLAEHAEAQHYGDEFGEPLPSIVAIDRATGVAIGGRKVWEARERYIDSGQYHIVQSVKWKLGKDQVWVTEQRTWSPREVTSFILTQLSDRAAALGIDRIDRAAITIPVDFPASSRTELRLAAEAADIELSTFVTESTAAFMRYLPQLRHCHYVAVFDWGGGTLDISILEIRGGTIFELSTEGMEIAGDEIDLDLARAIHARVMEQRHCAIPFESMPAADRDNLRTKCERAKCQLTSLDSTDVLLTSYGEGTLHFVLERAWFESLITAHVDLAIETLTKAIENCRLSFDALDRLLIIGGSSKIRLLQSKLRADRRFSAALYVSEQAEWDVAHGAAIVELSPGGYETAESIGIMLSDNTFYEIISHGERAFKRQRELALSLVEDSRQANIIVEKRAKRDSAGSERILAFSVDTLGFDLEELRLNYNITHDLILKLRASSAAMGSRDGAGGEYGKLRFAYHIDD
jgi:molecular chaperone DnaK